LFRLNRRNSLLTRRFPSAPALSPEGQSDNEHTRNNHDERCDEGHESAAGVTLRNDSGHFSRLFVGV